MQHPWICVLSAAESEAGYKRTAALGPRGRRQLPRIRPALGWLVANLGS